MTRTVRLWHRLPVAGSVLALLTAWPALAVDIANPNMSRDAAYCLQLTQKFHEAVAPRANDPNVAEARKTGERGAFLCRMDRYREGITRLEEALTALSNAPK